MDKRLKKFLAFLGFTLVVIFLFALIFSIFFYPNSPLRAVLPFFIWPASIIMPYLEEDRRFPRRYRALLASFFPIALVTWLSPIYIVALPQFWGKPVEPSIINGLVTASSICFAFTGALFIREKIFLYHIVTLISIDIMSLVVLGFCVFFFGLDVGFGSIALAVAASSFLMNAVTAFYLFFRHTLKLGLKIDQS